MRRTSLFLAATLAACPDRLFESPYVLNTGLGEARSLAPDVQRHFVVATPEGVVEVAGDGAFRTLAPGPALAVSSLGDTLVTLRPEVVTWADQRLAAPGAVDVQAGWQGEFWLLTPDAALAIDGGTGRTRARAAGFSGARAVALGPARDRILVVTESALYELGPLPPQVEGSTPDVPVSTLATGLIDAQAAAVDDRGRVYVAQGSPRGLWRIPHGGQPPVLVARFLEGARDLHFGVGDLLRPDAVYIAMADGTLAYLQPP